MTIDLIILTYNEIEGLKYFLPSIPPRCRNSGLAGYWGVDGGSSDGSLELYRQYGIRYVVQEKRGRGEAFLQAFRESKADALIFFSPDGNEDLDDLPLFVEALRQGADMVIASRMMKGARNEEDDQIFRWRKWVNQLFTLAANLLWNRNGRYITDTINGFRAIRREAWDAMRINASDYTVEYQSTIHSLKLKLKVVEFPTREGKRIGGESYAKSLPTGIKFLRLLWEEMIAGPHFPDDKKPVSC